MKNFSLTSLTFLVGTLMSTQASSAVVSASATNYALCNSGVSISSIAPTTTGTSASNTNCTVRIYDEAQSSTLTSNLLNDPINLTPGTGILTALAGTVAAGTLVDSFMIDYQPSTLLQGVQGSVTFSQKILAVVYSQPGFGATSYLENGGTAYSYGGLYGIEPILGDQLSFSGNTLNFRFLTSSLIGGDHLRVITEVPLPTTLALLALGGLGVFSFRKKKTELQASEGSFAG
jgi:PEP-CTERM motif